MNNLLPAISISSFVHLNKTVSPGPKEYLFPEKYLNKGKSNYAATAEVKQVAEINYSSAARIRVVAVCLYNNTSETIILKKSLRIQEENLPGEMVDFMPSALTKKQSVSVYFMYNLLLQMLPKADCLNFPGNYKSALTSRSETKSFIDKDIFISSTQNLDLTAKLKEANLFYKSLAPGETLTGMLLCLSSSAAPLQFYLG